MESEIRYIIVMENGYLWTEKIFIDEETAYRYLLDCIRDLHSDEAINMIKRIQQGNLKVVQAKLILV